MQALNTDVWSMNSELPSQPCHLSGCLPAISRVCWRMSGHREIDLLSGTEVVCYFTALFSGVGLQTGQALPGDSLPMDLTL